MKKITGLIAFMLLVFNNHVFTQQLKEFHGKVVDENTTPLYGASVMVKNTSRGATTNSNGDFSIRANANDTLEISSAGFETQSIAAKFLPEKVVLKKRRHIVPKELHYPENEMRADVAVALSGRAPGIMITGKSRQTQRIGYNPPFNTEGYAAKDENEFKSTKNNPLSTFSLDVDAASYSNVRRFINQGEMPPAGAVRVEEMINYFTYNYPQPANGKPFSINTEYAVSPWNKDHGLLMINLQGKKIPVENLPAANLVFLIDVSGSMMPANKLPLVQSAMKLLAGQLRAKDKVTIVTYAGNTSVLLPPTSGEEKTKIKDAIDRLSAGGSTNGSAAIELAYKSAQENFIKNGNNRIILCTDGDFNVGQTSDAALQNLIEEKRKSGVFLTVLGFGMGNYKDNKMQILAQKGNGSHAYIDGLTEARKVLINEFGGTLFTIAKDVKFQVEFNPAKVQGYRLVGYETRLLNDEDFNNDEKDAGEMGSGHTVTAFYEIIPAGIKTGFLKNVDDLKYQSTNKPLKNGSGELATVKLRYKEPDENKSQLLYAIISSEKKSFENASENFRFAGAVAGLGQLLSNSKFKGDISYNKIYDMAKNALGKDEEGYRYEFMQLVKRAETIGKNVEPQSNEGL